MEDSRRSLSDYSTQINLSAEKAHFLHKTICVLDFANGILIILYVGLLLFCLFLLFENWPSCKSGQSSGLLWYLGCTSILCICRFTGFALVLSKGTGKQRISQLLSNSSVNILRWFSLFQWWMTRFFFIGYKILNTLLRDYFYTNHYSSCIIEGHHHDIISSLSNRCS